MSFTNVDRIGYKIIRKLHSPRKDKDFGYIIVENEASDGQVYSTLTEARSVAGFISKPTKVLTAPKLSNSQNQKGYRPSGSTGKKASVK